jgi:hypothetical protein
MRTAFSFELNEDGFFIENKWKRLFHRDSMRNRFFGWVEWGRLFHMSWTGTAFSYELNEDCFELNEDGFFIWIKWGRLFIEVDEDGFFIEVEWETAFSAGLNGDGFFGWVKWGRLSQMGWMRTAFSNALNEDGFFIWVKWGRLFRLNWMGTAFSYELNGDGFFDWVEWERLSQMSWMKTTFSNELNEDGFFGCTEWKSLFQMSWMKTSSLDEIDLFSFQSTARRTRVLSLTRIDLIDLLLRRFMIEKYSSKNIDDKRLISINFNLIYWSEYWLFDVLQLTSIEIYLYFTIYEMSSFDVELDSYLNRFHVVRWISRNEILRESFNKTFVFKSFAHFMIRSLKI